MMTSDLADGKDPTTAFVWIWLPGAKEPVVCGRLDDDARRISFSYAASYLVRSDALPIYEPELALQRGPQFSLDGARLPLCIDDAMPDSWGRRLVNLRLGEPTADFGELTYLLASGSDRIGALDFQDSPTDYVPREADHPSLDDLANAAARVEEGSDLDPTLMAALLRGTSIGGARPKALLDGPVAGLIAKFSSATDTYPVVQGEFVAMELARRAGIDAATVELTRAVSRHALLVHRFDRDTTGCRRRVVSALTLLGLNTFPSGRYATYPQLSDQIRARFTEADSTLRELFARISFNILCGNTDDHGRNHAAYLREDGLALTPAYDLCPQARSGGTASQAMAFGREGQRESRIAPLLDASGTYHLERSAASDLVEHQIAVIRSNWEDVCDHAELTRAERAAFMGRQFLNPFALGSGI